MGVDIEERGIRSQEEDAVEHEHYVDAFDNKQHSTSSEQDRDDGVSGLELVELESFNTTNPDSKHSKPQEQGMKDATTPLSLARQVLDFAMDWCFTMLIGFLVVSYWRGTWTLLDIWSCNQPESSGMINGQVFCFVGLQSEAETADLRQTSAWHSVLAGYCLLAVGLYAMNRGWWQPSRLRAFRHLHDPSVRSTMSANSEATTDFFVTRRKTVIRFAMVYVLGNGTVCLWRGVWYLLDAHVFSDDALKSFWTTTVAGFLLCLVLCSGASLLAPPAIFLLDGPSRSAPPLASTILVSYRSLTLPVGDADMMNELDPMPVVLMDMALSYLVLPWGVVGFWRGLWSLMDHYLWGFTVEDQDLHRSIWVSLAIGILCLFLASDDISQFIPDKNRSSVVSSVTSESAGRVRTAILAVGAVNFWRAVWYIWDEWFGQTSVWSAALSHIMGVLGLFSLGCLACIAAPPATTGVDAAAHPQCADEPLFHNVPVAHEALFVCAMGRSPDRLLGERADAENFLPPAVSERFATSLRNIDSCFNIQNRDESISKGYLSQRHQSVRRGNDFFRNR